MRDPGRSDARVARRDDTTSDGTLRVAFSPGTEGAALLLVYTPGDGSPGQILSGAGGEIALKGRITSASTTVEAG